MEKTIKMLKEYGPDILLDLVLSLVFFFLGVQYSNWKRNQNPENSPFSEEFVKLDMKDQKKLDRIIEEITEPGMNRVEQIKAVHDWIVIHTEYDNTLTQHNASSTLNDGLAVCSGYAALFQAFMDTMEIPCMRIVGKITESKSKNSCHAWNAVQLEDGMWYFVDVCWDDPNMKGSTDYPDGKNLRYKYFLFGKSEMEKHREPDQLPEGRISDGDYNWNEWIK